MKVYLKGLNGCLDMVIKDAEAIMYNGDKIHIALNPERDGIIKGHTVNRANYSVAGVFEETRKEVQYG